MLSRRVASAVERSAAWAGLRRGQCGGARAGSVSWTDARFGGATLVLRAGPLPEPEQLEKEFAVAMGEVRAADKKGVWLRLGLEQGNALGIAAKHGFRFHHADGEYAMLLNWLPKGRCPVPDFATHVVGLGGMCINEKNEVLVVKELRAASSTSQGNWKLPGGLVDLGEELDLAVSREVFEETGVHAVFQALLAIRHQHGAAFGRDDAYMVCLLAPQSSAITVCKEEIADATWLPLREYYEVTKAASVKQGVDENFNCFVARRVLAAAEEGASLSDLGMAGIVKESPTGYLPGVTGLTNKKTYRIYSGWRT